MFSRVLRVQFKQELNCREPHSKFGGINSQEPIKSVLLDPGCQSARAEEPLVFAMFECPDARHRINDNEFLTKGRSAPPKGVPNLPFTAKSHPRHLSMNVRHRAHYFHPFGRKISRVRDHARIGR